MLKIEHVTKKYGTKKVIDDVSLTVNKGSIAVLLGESGVGKSTLLRVLNNLETIDSGTLYFNNEKFDPATLNKKHLVGMVFQHFNLFEHLTVEQNITLALEKVLGKSSNDAKKIAHDLLASYGMADKADMYISDLSGGQKQRLALARSLALKPQIICLDEPTSALDPLLTTYVANNIQDLANQGYIVLIATHDTALLDKLDCTIYLMQEGKVTETAQSQNFIHNKQNYPKINRFVSGVINE